MDKNLVKQIYDLKIKQIKAKINLKVEEEAYFASELDCILNLLKLEELKELKADAESKYAKTKKLQKNVTNINKKIAKEGNETTPFDAKHFYELSTKNLAYDSLIKDCKLMINKLNNKELQI
ncbi:MAG: hypothetical protein ACI4TT_04345 [Christensenellales bacterium]